MIKARVLAVVFLLGLFTILGTFLGGLETEDMYVLGYVIGGFMLFIGSLGVLIHAFVGLEDD
jgi:hypothetical protein